MAPKGTCRGRSTRVGQVVRAALKRNFHRAAGRILCRRLKYATSFDSQRCESRSRPYLGRRLDPAWCFASDDWYGVWEVSVSAFSFDTTGLFVGLFAGDKMEESDDGSIACGVVIGRCYMKALLWGTLSLRLGRANLVEVLSGSLGCRIRALLTGEILTGWWTVNREFVGYGKAGVVGREECVLGHHT
ncbi:hypothetical protein V6N13_116928 [Hibiscus sabdariffa]